MVESEGSFGLSKDERKLTEEAMKTEINKIRKAIDIVENQENLDGRFKQGSKRYEIKLKMELYETISSYIDLLSQNSEAMAQKSGYYEDKCYFFRVLGDFSRYGISVATTKLSYSERSKLFTQEDEDNISYLNSKSEKFKTMSLEFYTQADKFAR